MPALNHARVVAAVIVLGSIGRTFAVPPEVWRAELWNAELVTSDRISRLAKQVDGIVLEVGTGDPTAERRAARRIRESGRELHYWVEVARCPQLADAHPEWMASLQGHSEWRRSFRDIPRPAEHEVVKVYPWVPILYRESFAAQLQRVTDLLRSLPPAEGVFLNDLQGAPSACGCGNLLCRWTADYGPVRTATSLADNAASRFVKKIAASVPGSRVVPVWVTECEQDDQVDLCGGVGCFEGSCWKRYTRQLMHVASVSPRIAVLVPFRTMGHDLPRYPTTAGWVTSALASFQTMPPQRGGRAVNANRLIAVLQATGVNPAEIAAQESRAAAASVNDIIMSHMAISQDWQPRVVRVPSALRQ